MTARTVLLPDLDDEITFALTCVEEVLLSLDGWEADDPDLKLPAPLAGGAALAAVQRLWDAIAPSQGQHARKAALGRVLAPDGRYEHIPLRAVDVDQVDVDTLAAAAAALGDPNADDHIRESVTEMAEGLIPGPHTGDPGRELVMRTAQLAGILDLADNGDMVLLRGLLTSAGPTVDLVLPPVGEDAYQRTASRINGMWQLADPLHRWQY